MNQRLIIGAGMGMLLVGKSAAGAAQAFALGSGRLVLMDVPFVFANLMQLVASSALLAFGVRSATSVAAVFGVVGGLTVCLSWWVLRQISSRGRARQGEYVAMVIRLVRMAAPYAVAGVMLQAIANFDVLILGLTHPSHVVGRYEPVVLGVARLTAFVSVLLMVAYLPAATRLISQGHRDAFAELYSAVSKVRYVISWPFVMLLATAPVALFQFVFGQGFLASPSVVNILLVGYVVDLVLGLNGQALVASGERRTIVLASLWPLIAMVGLSIFLVPPYGAIGAALATTVSVVVLNLSMSLTLHRSAGIQPFNRDLTLVILSSPLPLGLAMVLRPFVGGGLVAATIAVACGWFLWIGLLRQLSALRLDDILRFRPLRRAGRG